MDQTINDLLYGIPKGIDYTTISDELDLEDIPKERIEQVKGLLNNVDEYVVFQAARILASWGEDAGFDKLASLIDENNIDGFIDHRLHGYDETLYHVLWAFRGYYSQKYDNQLNEEEVRRKIYPYVVKIIKASNTQPFPITPIFSLIERRYFTEYVPLLKEHAMAIIDRPEVHGWKIYDVLELLLKIDADFVEQLLKQKVKTLQDFDFSIKDE